MSRTKLHITLLPSFPHFEQFAADKRIDGIRFNSAGITIPELANELAILRATEMSVPLWFDVKGRQPRVVSVNNGPTDFLDITLNHPIEVDVAAEPRVIFKAGDDFGIIRELTDGGQRLLFKVSPNYIVYPGSSLYINHPSFNILGQPFTEDEKEKIRMVIAAGLRQFYISFVWGEEDADELREIASTEIEIRLKIEDKKGLDFVANRFHKRPGESLVLARGDMYHALDHPMDILKAHRLLIEKDPEACAGSRMLLSVIYEDDPACTDLTELAWFQDIGYRNLLLCDSLCTKGWALERAVNLIEEFNARYAA